MFARGRSVERDSACSSAALPGATLKVKDQSVAAIVSWHCATNADLFMVSKTIAWRNDNNNRRVHRGACNNEAEPDRAGELYDERV